MALLLTLVILMLLSIFMVEFSFQTTLETRGIRNFQASFQARNAVKSMLKAVLEGLQTRDEITFFRQDLQFLQELNALAGVENACLPAERQGFVKKILEHLPWPVRIGVG